VSWIGPRLFTRAIALPTDHGAWVFLLSPLLIGLYAGGRFTLASGALVVAALAAFLLRQPVTILIKVVIGVRLLVISSLFTVLMLLALSRG
jgi:hypothetical protein